MNTCAMINNHELWQEWGQAAYRQKQVQEWVFHKRIFAPEQMSNIPRSLQQLLQDKLDWRLPQVLQRLDSPDGASKLLLSFEGKQQFEAVILRYDNRTSLCVSSQVGCKLACRFCQTGKLGFMRNLSVQEILGQFLLAQAIVHQEGRSISHVVFMGMGEPLQNYDNVVTTIRHLISDFGLSHRKVTLSTSGIVPNIERLSADLRVALAVSLHACRDELRSELMPINQRYPLAQLKQSLLQYQKQTQDKITFEYILIKGHNCGLREAKELVRFIHGFRAKVNLIPFNAHPGSPYQAPSSAEINRFQSYLSQRGVPAPVRYSKGLGVSAACGQLAAKKQGELSSVPQRHNLLTLG